MKHYSIVTIIALLVLLSILLIGCASSAAPAPVVLGGEWKVVHQAEAKQPARMVAFLDETFGVTGGFSGAGKAHYTTDGGETWTMAEDSGGCLYGVEIVDAQTVWVCGRIVGASFSTPGGIRMSADGGQTWNEQTDYQTSPGFCPLSFLDAQTGWVVNGDKLIATTDGATWEEVAVPDGLTNIAAISLRAPGEGYVLDGVGNLYITQDGGASWSSQTLGLAERYGEMKLRPFGEHASAAMRFLDADQGIVVLHLMNDVEDKFIALHTADGGQTWEEQTIPAEIGKPYLTRDGLLTVSSLIKPSGVTVLRYVVDDGG
jgi:photosystem II stability/assembly factor-like uncharacterized protein